MTQRDTILGGVAVLVGFVAAATGYVRAILAWIRGFAVVSVWIENDVVRAVTSYLHAQGRRGGGPRAYAAQTQYMRAHGHSEIVPYEEQDRASSMFWFRRRPVWVTKADKPLLDGHMSFRLSVLRSMLDPERLIIDACAWASEDLRQVRQRHHVTHHHGRSLSMDREGGRAPKAISGSSNLTVRGSARRLLCHDPEDIEPRPTLEGLDDMVMTTTVRGATEAIRRWFADRVWCVRRGIPWRAGFLYEGAPGSGKTSHARCVAVELDLPVHVFDLATMNNEDLRNAWLQMATDAPCMALIEDIDRVFNGDKNVAPPSGMLTSGGLTFNALLNAIDGIERHDGVLLVVTTNHLEKVDPAIKARKGRIDQVVHFGPLDHASRATLARRIVEDPELAERLAITYSNEHTSTFVASCCDVARRARYVSQVEPPINLGPMRTSAP